MISFKAYLEEVKKDPCWKGYKMLGMKEKGGKSVPNCVPEESEVCPKCGKSPCECDKLEEGATADAKGYKSKTGGLTQKGRDHYNSTTGSHLKAPVTKKPSTLKKGSKAYNRRKSFCARMSGVEGPMTKPNGEPTRKALALRKWNC